MPDEADSVTNLSEDQMKKRWILHLGGAIVVLAILLLLLLLVTNSLRTFVAILYSPFSFVIMLIIVIEYVILKGADRSRIYRLEIERLRGKRAEDTALWRELEGHLSDALQKIQQLDDSSASEKNLSATLSHLTGLRSKLQEILQILQKKT